MALYVRQDDKTRGVDELYTVQEGRLRPLSELYVKTDSGLKLVWEAYNNETWNRDQLWVGEDTW